MTATRILLVDDDRFFAKLTAAMLAPADVHIAKNGAEGLAMMKREPFDLLITDLLMPEKDGIETIVEICRRTSACRSSPSRAAANMAHATNSSEWRNSWAPPRRCRSPSRASS